MKKKLLNAVFVGILMLGVAFVQAFGQTLINELQVGNPTNDSPCDFIELRGTPGAPLTNLYLIAVAGDEGNGRGSLLLATNLGSQNFGSNGLLVVKGSGQCGTRTFPAGTTVVVEDRITNFGVLDVANTLSILLINSTNALPAVFTDLDAGDDGTLEGLPAGAAIVDALGYFSTVSAFNDLVYGGMAVNFDPANQEINRNGPDAITRFANNNTPNSGSAFYFGDIDAAGGAASTTYLDDDQRSPNFPAGGVLTPGAPNAPSTVAAPPTLFDFNGDRRADQGVFRNGNWLLNLSGGNQFRGVQWGQAGDTIAPADYDGDGTTDYAVWRAETLENVFYILRSQNNTVQIERFGRAGDIPVSGQWDADALADVAVYRPATTAGGQSFFFYNSSSVPGVDVVGIPWGTAGDVPVAADYDGDSRYDAAVYRGGTWFARLSSNGQLFSIQFGTASDIPVPADYNGDNRVDQAVFRNGVWFANLSPNNTFFTVPFGQAGDIPVPADYDGDNVDDQAVFRNGQWFARLSQSGGSLFALPFGQAGDEPIPAAYIP